MAEHVFSFSQAPKSVNNFELLAQIRAVDAAANLAISRDAGGDAVEVIVSTPGGTTRAAFDAVLSAHVPVKTEAESAAEAEEQRLRDIVSEKLLEPDFLAFVEAEISNNKGG